MRKAIVTLKMMLRPSNPGPYLSKRSNLTRDLPTKLVARPIVYEFPNKSKLGLTEWI